MRKLSPAPTHAWPNTLAAGQTEVSTEDYPNQARVKRVLEHDTSIPGVVAKVIEFDRKFSDRPYRESRIKRNKDL